MTTFYDDEKLAAYALGELDETERAELEAYVNQNQSAQDTVAEFRAAARLATDAFRDTAAPALSDAQRQQIRAQVRNANTSRAVPKRRNMRRWLVGLAAAAVVLIVVGVSLMPRTASFRSGAKSPSPEAAGRLLLSYQTPASAPAMPASRSPKLNVRADFTDAAAPAMAAPPPAPSVMKEQLAALGYVSAPIQLADKKAGEVKQEVEVKNGQSKSAQSEEQAPEESGHYLIKTANVNIETDNPQDAAKKLTEDVVAVGGYVSNLREQADGLGRYTVTLQVRVPADKLDGAMQTVESLGRILNRQVITQDVTEDYVDTDARIRNLQKTEERLLEHLSKAVLIESTLKIEQELTRVREQLERLEGHQRSMANRIHFSTIDVTFTEKPKAEPITPVETFSTGKVFSEAARSLVAFSQWACVKAIWLAVWSPIWAVIALAAWLGYRRMKVLRAKWSK